MKLGPAILTAALCLALTLPAAADEGAAAQSVRDAQAPFEALKMAAGLARWGREHRDPFALVEAARVRLSTPLQFVGRSPDGVGGARPEPTGEDEIAKAWLDEAEAMAGGDPRVAGLVKELRATGYKGRIGGPKVSFSRLPAGAAHRYSEAFAGNRPAVVYVEGDGDTDLILTVTSPDGAVACADRAPGDVKLCAWRPAGGGAYRVEVSNRGRVDNRYAFSTN